MMTNAANPAEAVSLSFLPIDGVGLARLEFIIEIGAAHTAGRKIGICGQAPSDYPEFAQFFVTEGIDSLSLNADSQLKTMLAIVDLETRLAQEGKTAGVGTQASR